MLPYDAERDLIILAAMADQLQPYLIEEQLFWPISGRLRGGMPRLTLGGFLLRRYQLTRLQNLLNARQQAVLNEALAAFEAARSEWAMNYARKLGREWEMRIRMLEEFLRDCDNEDVRGCIDHWPVQAAQRTILHLLLAERQDHGEKLTAEKAALARVDTSIRRYLQPGEGGVFLWSPELQAVYPRETFWWLWIAPPDDTEDIEPPLD